MNIDLDQIKLVAGTFVAVVGAVTLAWTFQPFALASDMERIETKLAMNLEDAVQQVQKLAVENAWGVAQNTVRVLEPEQEKIELQIIETDLRTDLPPEVKQRYLILLKRKQQALNTELTASRNRARSLAPAFATPQ